ncbi:MAG TPA: hypothetical protein VMH04_06540 [Candidatus Solibacter sp.]|nr:hypothetical protein [Candidatus Solibacter sp.]
MSDLIAAKVMIAVRDHPASDLDSLCNVLKLSPSVGKYQLENLLTELQAAGLIVHTGPAESLSGTFDVIPNWRRVQALLGISLTRLVEGPDCINVKPYFGKPKGSVGPLDVFVMMAFTKELHPIYEHILKVTKLLNLVTKRADDFFGAHHIMQDVWEAICAARVIIADCTGRNPNVFYEMGMAHTLGRKVIMITQNQPDVPFDVQSTRYILYKNTPHGLGEFESTLAETLRGELSDASEPPKKESFCP